MHFRAALELHGKSATGIEVPAAVVDALGQGKKPPVSVTINGYTYRTSIGVMGGRSLLPVNAENRSGAGVSAGDELDIEIELDSAPRVVEVPPDLAAALAADPLAQQKFDSLSYSHQRQHVLAVEGAKAADTRQRRIDSTLAKLRG